MAVRKSHLRSLQFLPGGISRAEGGCVLRSLWRRLWTAPVLERLGARHLPPGGHSGYVFLLGGGDKAPCTLLPLWTAEKVEVFRPASKAVFFKTKWLPPPQQITGVVPTILGFLLWLWRQSFNELRTVRQSQLQGDAAGQLLWERNTVLAAATP